MRLLAFLSSLAAAALTASVAAAPAAPPQFEVIFSGTLDVGELGTIKGPLGTRVHAPINGGNFTDPSGELVATLFPTADTGLVSQSGIFFPEVAIVIRWNVDGKLAYLRAEGVGIFGNDLTYVHLETDSETWSGLNGRFLVGDLTIDPQNVTVYTLFGTV